MGERTAISWTDRTHNPWWGCTKVSPGCDRCYAETFDRRVGGAHWGPHAERRRIGEKTRNDPFRWNRQAEKSATRVKVFSGSMCDVFDNAVPAEWRDELWATIRGTPWLIWQLLTKRPQNIAKMLPPDWGCGYFNVWLGTTTENQAEADRRIPALARIPATVRFLSCEPQLEQIAPDLRGIHWVICGGESGGKARPMRRAWATNLLADCRAEEVAFFFKQVGSNRGADWPGGITGKGDDPAEWPPEIRIQQFPNADYR